MKKKIITVTGLKSHLIDIWYELIIKLVLKLLLSFNSRFKIIDTFFCLWLEKNVCGFNLIGWSYLKSCRVNIVYWSIKYTIKLNWLCKEQIPYLLIIAFYFQRKSSILLMMVLYWTLLKLLWNTILNGDQMVYRLTLNGLNHPCLLHPYPRTLDLLF